MQQPHFTSSALLTVRAAPGANAILHLPLPSGSPPFQHLWSRAGASLDERFVTAADARGVTLTLSSARVGDTGVYTLETSNAVGKDTARVRLEVAEDEAPVGDDPPSFLRRLQDLTVKVGTRTRFLVEIVSSTECKVTWYRNERRLMEAERVALARDGNFWCADVSAVSVDDAGRWTCTAENTGGRASCSAHLNVLVPKAYKRPEFVEELRAILTEQGTVSLECKVIGVPTPILRWFKDSKEIKAGDVFALTAKADDPTSLGTYTCEAVNCMGRSYSSSKVHVVGRGTQDSRPPSSLSPEPPPIFTKELEDQYIKICEPLSLSCQIVVPPWPRNVVWYNKEGKIDASDRYHIIEDGMGGYLMEISSAEWPDEGEWKCVATSSGGRVGISSCLVHMEVSKNYRKPRFMENLQAVLTEEGLVSFECKVVGFPTPVLSWFKDGQELKPGDVYQLTGTNSLGSYCCIAKNCMGQASSSAELTVEDIQNQLNEEEKLQLFSKNQAPKFISGLKSIESKIDEPYRFSVKVSIPPVPSILWYRDDQPVDDSQRCLVEQDEKGTFALNIKKLEFVDQAEWKCVAMNDFGHSVTSCFLKLIIPRHYKKPRFLENLQVLLSEEGAVNLECKVIGVPQPVLKWYKDGEELKPGDIHRIISGQDGTCCLGTYTCEAQNCMGIASSSALLLGLEDSMKSKDKKITDDNSLQRNLSLSTIHEERTSQMYDTPMGDITVDDKGEISFSFDGKEVSVSLYETPDLTEEEALQIVEMYADQLSENVTEHNVVELPPLRFIKETSTSGNLLMEAIIVDVCPEYFNTPEEDLRTEADVDDLSIAYENAPLQSYEKLMESTDYLEQTMAMISDEKSDIKLKRKKSDSQRSADDFFSLSKDDSLSESKSDRTQVLSGSEVQSFASAKSSSKVKSKMTMVFSDENIDDQQKEELILPETTIKERSSLPPVSKKERRGSKSSYKSSSGSEKSFGKAKYKESQIESASVNFVVDTSELIRLNNELCTDIASVINDIQKIESEVILKSSVIGSAATASRSLDLITNLSNPLNEIHNIYQSTSIESYEVAHRWKTLPQSLKMLNQSISMLRKCLDIESDVKTLVKKTCSTLIDSTSLSIQHIMIRMESSLKKNPIEFNEAELSGIFTQINEIVAILKSSEEKLRNKKPFETEGKMDNTPEMRHLIDTQKCIFKLKNILLSILHITELAKIGKLVKMSTRSLINVVLEEISPRIQELQTALERVEMLCVVESTSDLPKYNTSVIESVMDLILNLRSSFEQLSAKTESGADDENLNVTLSLIIENINKISSEMCLIENKIGKLDILQSEHKLDALQKMAQILIAFENSLPYLDKYVEVKNNMTELHKKLTKTLEVIIESNERNKYLAFMEISDIIKRISSIFKDLDDDPVSSFGSLFNSLSILKHLFVNTIFESELNCNVLSLISDIQIQIQESINKALEEIDHIDSEKIKDLPVSEPLKYQAQTILELIEKFVSTVSTCLALDNTLDIDNRIKPSMEKIKPVLNNLQRYVADVFVLSNTEHVDSLTSTNLTETYATVLNEINENIQTIAIVVQENVQSIVSNKEIMLEIAQPIYELNTALSILQDEIVYQKEQNLSLDYNTQLANLVLSLESCVIKIQEHVGVEAIDDMSTLEDISAIKTTADISPETCLPINVSENMLLEEGSEFDKLQYLPKGKAQLLRDLFEHIEIMQHQDTTDTLEALSDISDFSPLKVVPNCLNELHAAIEQTIHPKAVENVTEMETYINYSNLHEIAHPLHELQKCLLILDTDNIPLYENILDLPSNKIHSVIVKLAVLKKIIDHLQDISDLSICPIDTNILDKIQQMMIEGNTLHLMLSNMKINVDGDLPFKTILSKIITLLESLFEIDKDNIDMETVKKIKHVKNELDSAFDCVLSLNSMEINDLKREAKIVDAISRYCAVIEDTDFIESSKMSNLSSISSSHLSVNFITEPSAHMHEVVTRFVQVLENIIPVTPNKQNIEDFLIRWTESQTILNSICTREKSFKRMIRVAQEYIEWTSSIEDFRNLCVNLPPNVQSEINAFTVDTDEIMKRCEEYLFHSINQHSDLLLENQLLTLHEVRKLFSDDLKNTPIGFEEFIKDYLITIKSAESVAQNLCNILVTDTQYIKIFQSYDNELGEEFEVFCKNSLNYMKNIKEDRLRQSLYILMDKLKEYNEFVKQVHHCKNLIIINSLTELVPFIKEACHNISNFSENTTEEQGVSLYLKSSKNLKKQIEKYVSEDMVQIVEEITAVLKVNNLMDSVAIAKELNDSITTSKLIQNDDKCDDLSLIEYKNIISSLSNSLNIGQQTMLLNGNALKEIVGFESFNCITEAISDLTTCLKEFQHPSTNNDIKNVEQDQLESTETVEDKIKEHIKQYTSDEVNTLKSDTIVSETGEEILAETVTEQASLAHELNNSLGVEHDKLLESHVSISELTGGSIEAAVSTVTDLQNAVKCIPSTESTEVAEQMITESQVSEKVVETTTSPLETLKEHITEYTSENVAKTLIAIGAAENIDAFSESFSIARELSNAIQVSETLVSESALDMPAKEVAEQARLAHELNHSLGVVHDKLLERHGSISELTSESIEVAVSVVTKLKNDLKSIASIERTEVAEPIITESRVSEEISVRGTDTSALETLKEHITQYTSGDVAKTLIAVGAAENNDAFSESLSIARELSNAIQVSETLVSESALDMPAKEVAEQARLAHELNHSLGVVHDKLLESHGSISELTSESIEVAVSVVTDLQNDLKSIASTESTDVAELTMMESRVSAEKSAEEKVTSPLDTLKEHITQYTSGDVAKTLMAVGAAENIDDVFSESLSIARELSNAIQVSEPLVSESALDMPAKEVAEQARLAHELNHSLGVVHDKLLESHGSISELTSESIEVAVSVVTDLQNDLKCIASTERTEVPEPIITESRVSEEISIKETETSALETLKEHIARYTSGDVAKTLIAVGAAENIDDVFSESLSIARELSNAFQVSEPLVSESALDMPAEEVAEQARLAHELNHSLGVVHDKLLESHGSISELTSELIEAAVSVVTDLQNDLNCIASTESAEVAELTMTDSKVSAEKSADEKVTSPLDTLKEHITQYTSGDVAKTLIAVGAAENIDNVFSESLSIARELSNAIQVSEPLVSESALDMPAKEVAEQARLAHELSHSLIVVHDKLLESHGSISELTSESIEVAVSVVTDLNTDLKCSATIERTEVAEPIITESRVSEEISVKETETSALETLKEHITQYTSGDVAKTLIAVSAAENIAAFSESLIIARELSNAIQVSETLVSESALDMPAKEVAEQARLGHELNHSLGVVHDKLLESHGSISELTSESIESAVSVVTDLKPDLKCIAFIEKTEVAEPIITESRVSEEISIKETETSALETLKVHITQYTSGDVAKTLIPVGAAENIDAFSESLSIARELSNAIQVSEPLVSESALDMPAKEVAEQARLAHELNHSLGVVHDKLLESHGSISKLTSELIEAAVSVVTDLQNDLKSIASTESTEVAEPIITESRVSEEISIKETETSALETLKVHITQYTSGDVAKTLIAVGAAENIDAFSESLSIARELSNAIQVSEPLVSESALDMPAKEVAEQARLAHELNHSLGVVHDKLLESHGSISELTSELIEAAVSVVTDLQNDLKCIASTESTEVAELTMTESKVTAEKSAEEKVTSPLDTLKEHITQYTSGDVAKTLIAVGAAENIDDVFSESLSIARELSNAIQVSEPLVSESALDMPAKEVAEQASLGHELNHSLGVVHDKLLGSHGSISELTSESIEVAVSVVTDLQNDLKCIASTERTEVAEPIITETGVFEEMSVKEIETSALGQIKDHITQYMSDDVAKTLIAIGASEHIDAFTESLSLARELSNAIHVSETLVSESALDIPAEEVAEQARLAHELNHSLGVVHDKLLESHDSICELTSESIEAAVAVVTEIQNDLKLIVLKEVDVQQHSINEDELLRKTSIESTISTSENMQEDEPSKFLQMQKEALDLDAAPLITQEIDSIDLVPIDKVVDVSSLTENIVLNTMEEKMEIAKGTIMETQSFIEEKELEHAVIALPSDEASIPSLEQTVEKDEKAQSKDIQKTNILSEEPKSVFNVETHLETIKELEGLSEKVTPIIEPVSIVDLSESSNIVHVMTEPLLVSEILSSEHAISITSEQRDDTQIIKEVIDVTNEAYQNHEVWSHLVIEPVSLSSTSITEMPSAELPDVESNVVEEDAKKVAAPEIELEHPISILKEGSSEYATEELVETVTDSKEEYITSKEKSEISCDTLGAIVVSETTPSESTVDMKKYDNETEQASSIHDLHHALSVETEKVLEGHGELEKKECYSKEFALAVETSALRDSDEKSQKANISVVDVKTMSEAESFIVPDELLDVLALDELEGDSKYSIEYAEKLLTSLSKTDDEAEVERNVQQTRDLLDEIQTVIIKLRRDYDGTDNDAFIESLEDLECNVRCVQLQMEDKDSSRMLKEAVATFSLVKNIDSKDVPKNPVEYAKKIIKNFNLVSDETDKTINLIDIAMAFDSNRHDEFNLMSRNLEDMRNILYRLKAIYLSSIDSFIERGIELNQSLVKLEDQTFLIEKQLLTTNLSNRCKENFSAAINSIFSSISNMRETATSAQKEYLYSNYGKPSGMLLKSIKKIEGLNDRTESTNFINLAQSLRNLLKNFEDIKFYVLLDKTARIPNDSTITESVVCDLKKNINSIINDGNLANDESYTKTVKLLDSLIDIIRSKPELVVKAKIPMYKAIAAQFRILTDSICNESASDLLNTVSEYTENEDKSEETLKHKNKPKTKTVNTETKPPKLIDTIQDTYKSISEFGEPDLDTEIIIDKLKLSDKHTLEEDKMQVETEPSHIETLLDKTKLNLLETDFDQTKSEPETTIDKSNLNLQNVPEEPEPAKINQFQSQDIAGKLYAENLELLIQNSGPETLMEKLESTELDITVDQIRLEKPDVIFSKTPEIVLEKQETKQREIVLDTKSEPEIQTDKNKGIRPEKKINEPKSEEYERTFEKSESSHLENVCDKSKSDAELIITKTELMQLENISYKSKSEPDKLEPSESECKVKSKQQETLTDKTELRQSDTDLMKSQLEQLESVIDKPDIFQIKKVSNELKLKPDKSVLAQLDNINNISKSVPETLRDKPESRRIEENLSDKRELEHTMLVDKTKSEILIDNSKSILKQNIVEIPKSEADMPIDQCKFEKSEKYIASEPEVMLKSEPESDITDTITTEKEIVKPKLDQSNTLTPSTDVFISNTETESKASKTLSDSSKLLITKPATKKSHSKLPTLEPKISENSSVVPDIITTEKIIDKTEIKQSVKGIEHVDVTSHMKDTPQPINTQDITANIEARKTDLKKSKSIEIKKEVKEIIMEPEKYSDSEDTNKHKNGFLSKERQSKGGERKGRSDLKEINKLHDIEKSVRTKHDIISFNNDGRQYKTDEHYFEDKTRTINVKEDDVSSSLLTKKHVPYKNTEIKSSYDQINRETVRGKKYQTRSDNLRTKSDYHSSDSTESLKRKPKCTAYDFNDKGYDAGLDRPSGYREKTVDDKDIYDSTSYYSSNKLSAASSIFKASTLRQEAQLRSSLSPFPVINIKDYSESSSSTVIPRKSKAKSESRTISDKKQYSPRDINRKPIFSTHLTDRTAVEGSRVKLTCSVLSTPDIRIKWMKNDILLDDKTRYRTKITDGLITLEVLNAVPTDSAEYTCMVENDNGSIKTSAHLKVYPSFDCSPIPPTFTRSIRDSYHLAEDELVLECRIRGQPLPSITWLKNGNVIDCRNRYRSNYLADGVCCLIISSPTPEDSGNYTCRAENSIWSDSISHVVNYSGKERHLGLNIHTLERSYFYRHSLDVRKPHFATVLSDHTVTKGGTIGLQVEIKGSPTKVEWFREDIAVTDLHRNANTFVEHGLYTLALTDVSESDSGVYTCRAWSSSGNVDMKAAVTIVHPNNLRDGKPAIIVSRPEKNMCASVGDDISISCRVQGDPKPKAMLMKGARDITISPRTCKMTSDDYVLFTLKRCVVSDAGTYCIFVRNLYGCDRAFVTIDIRQRGSSDNLISDWTYPYDDNSASTPDRCPRTVPDRIIGEPTVADGGNNWITLAWQKPDISSTAPVQAYKIELWQLGKEGGARWIEVGFTPLNSFDIFNLKQGEDYHFRVTPRNRYGWGEAVQTSTPVRVGSSGTQPEFMEPLPGQLKVLIGESAVISCDVQGKPMPEIIWMRDGRELEQEDDHISMAFNGRHCSLTINSVREDDEARYSCEARNSLGHCSTYARLTVVTDRLVWEADAKLKRERSAEMAGEYPPQFTMRLRDRRVQSTYPVRLTCQVIGCPTPDVTWYKDGMEVNLNDHHIKSQDEHFHTLEIAPTTLDDAGVYEAMARNSRGAVCCRCNLVVDKGIRAYIAPEFCLGLDPSYTVNEGDELRISAVVEAYPTVGLTWYRDGVRLRSSRRAIMTLDRDGVVELTLAFITTRDAGVYTCTASNEVGKASTSTRLCVIEGANIGARKKSSPLHADNNVQYSKEPMFIRKPRSSEAHEGDTVIIECEVAGDPKPDVYWLRDFLKPDYYRDAIHFKRVRNGPEYRLEIPHAKLDYTGAYSVVARNVHGEAKAVISLQILVKDISNTSDAHNVQYGRVDVIPQFEREINDLMCCDGDDVEFECQITGDPQPDVKWFRYSELIKESEYYEMTYDGSIARLKIKQVTADDEGMYVCEATNRLGKTTTSAACLVVYPPGEPNTLSQQLRRPSGLLSAQSTPRSTPRCTPARSVSSTPVPERKRYSPSRQISPKFYTYPHNKVVDEGSYVKFQCSVTGHPVPWATWDKDGVIVTSTGRITVKEKDDLRLIEIEEVTVDDAGLYRIVIENDFGRVEASARLDVITHKGTFYAGVKAYSASPRRTLPYRKHTAVNSSSRLETSSYRAEHSFGSFAPTKHSSYVMSQEEYESLQDYFDSMPFCDGNGCLHDPIDCDVKDNDAPRNDDSNVINKHKTQPKDIMICSTDSGFSESAEMSNRDYDSGTTITRGLRETNIHNELTKALARLTDKPQNEDVNCLL